MPPAYSVAGRPEKKPAPRADRRLVVHVGPPKTATTSLQHALFLNRNLLASVGVYLPHSGRHELAPLSVAHHHLAWELLEHPKFRPEQGGWDALADELSGVDAPVVLLSSEVLSLVVVDPARGDELDRRLRGLGRDVTVVYVVRDQLSQVNSAYAQRVKMLDTTQTFEEHARQGLESGRVDLEAQTKRWYAASDIRLAAPLFNDLAKGNPLSTLLRSAGIELHGRRLAVPDEPTNVTLGPMGVAAAILLRCYLEGLDPGLSSDDPAVRHLHREVAQEAERAGWCANPYWGWDPAFAQDAVAALTPSNERFSQAVWGRPWPVSQPVGRPRATVDLARLPPQRLDRVHDFVAEMARLYVRLREGRESA